MRTLLAAVLLALSMVAPRAGGLIIVHDWQGRESHIYPPPRVPRLIPPPRHFPLAPLEISSESIDAKIKDQVATVTIDQEFYNPNAQQLEGTFLFPLPKGAQLDKFKMEIAGKMVEAELLSAEKARTIYEDIVRRAKDPALLEFEGRDCLRVRIFPIEANSRKKVHLAYTQLLKLDSGMVDFRVPISSEKYSARPIQRLSLNLDLESSTPLKTIYSPSHNIEPSRPNSRHATVKLDEKQLAADKDFQLIFAAEKSEVALKVLTHRVDGDGYFLLFASPGIDAPEKSVVAKDVAFVLDTSGSMSGQKIEQARNALLFCVRNLNAQDRFEVLRFSTETEPLFHELRSASKDNVRKAESFIQKLQAQNGTAIDEALRQALELRSTDSSRPFVVIFLTDGLPTVGETREERILANVHDRAKSSRIFCFGIGNDVNTHLLDKIAEDTRAFTQYVMTGEDIEVKVSSFFSKIRDPLLANVKIDVTGSSDIRLTKQYPSALPDLFKGEQLILAGRYSGSGKAMLKLTGSVNGETKSFTEKIEFPERDSDHEFIPRLWATRRVGALLDQIRLNGENKELRDEITDLARQYGIVTPYTAYLIMEDEAARGVPVRAQAFPEAAKKVELRRELGVQYNNYLKDKSGELAVNSAVNNQVLRQAQNAAPAARYQYYSSGTATAPGQPRASRLDAATAAAPNLVEQQATSFAAGQAFYQNGSQWIDNRIQKLNNASTNRIQFNSDAYFAFAAKNPSLNSVLSLGANIQFVHNGQIIEIHE
jgi:Ca-activated chloride channel family protein